MTEETLFHAALSRPTLPERAAFLDGACAGRPELRAAVEALLAAHEASGAFLNPPDAAPVTVDSEAVRPGTQATGVHASAPGDDPSPVSITAQYERKPGAEILIAGRYTLQEKIGEGGMGEVWVAKQSEPVKRKVALKLIKPGMDSRAVLQRFEQERQALARMDHTNIAKVLDAGMTPNGQPFFVMELVNGLPLNKFCDEVRLTPKERLELFVPICQAVQHAHQKGIVHRDLKPANILITMIDGNPVPKVIDFGVAKATAGKLTDESMDTQFGAVVGTLEYMSPEQAGFSGEDIDTRADIYSLGVILYELLTGLRPIDAARLKQAALTEMIRIIREEEPSKPSTRLSTDALLPSMAAMRQIEPRKLMALLRGDLDWVVMKCLEKHRERRYETANALARDIQRYLNGDAVEACPPSLSYRMGKFLKRNKGKVLAASFVFLALVMGFIGTAWGMFRADRARQAEAAQRKIAVAEKKKAATREELAIDAVKKFRDAVANNPELKSNPALEPLRKTLLKEPLAFFKALRDRLQADHDTRTESLHRLAQASLDLGLLTSEIGDKQDALIAIREAEAIYRKLAEGAPNEGEWRRLQASSLTEIGGLLLASGKTAEALKVHESTLAIQQRLVDANPDARGLRSNLAGAHHNLGIVLAGIGRPAEALKAFELALATQQRLVDDYPENAAFRVFLANHHQNLGLMLCDLGRTAEGLKHYEASLAIRQKLAAADPTAISLQEAVADSHYHVGSGLHQTGRPAEAEKAFESAIAILRKLVVANPTVTDYQSRLAKGLDVIGYLMSNTGRPAEGMKSYESALTLQRKLVDANPTIVLFQSLLAGIYNNIGLLWQQMGEPAKAKEAIESALAIRRKLATEHGEMPEFASELGGSLNNVAAEDLIAGRFEAARTRLREAIEWQRKALASNPAHPTYRQYLNNHLTNLRRVARKLGDAEGVAEAERELAKLRDSDPAMIALDARLSAIIKGDQQSKDNAERLQLAPRAYDKALHATAARLWADALAADPKLGDDRQAQHRYNAACAAALAASGQGKDDPSPDAAAKAKLRRQALDWLTAELKAWKRISMIVEPGNKELVAKTLAHWKQDADLAGIRDEAVLAKLPEDERTLWQSLWADVDAMLKRVHGPKP